jgi:hypothetical protein
MVFYAVTPSHPVRALEILCLFRQLSRLVPTVATARCRYIPSDANVDDVDSLAVRSVQMMSGKWRCPSFTLEPAVWSQFFSSQRMSWKWHCRRNAMRKSRTVVGRGVGNRICNF